MGDDGAKVMSEALEISTSLSSLYLSCERRKCIKL